MNKDKQFHSMEEVRDYAGENNKVLVVFDSYVLDATSFAKHHPGGAGLILNYQAKDITDEMNAHFPLSLTMANSMVVGSLETEIRRLINPDKALLPQIWEMDHATYLKIINSPHWLFVESPKMFESSFCEQFSHNKWYNIFIVPFIISAYNFLNTTWANPNYPILILTLLLGIFVFTLTEYLIHRFIFHS